MDGSRQDDPTPPDAAGAAPPEPAHSRLTVWTRRQRTTLAAALLPVVAWLAYLALTRPTYLPDPQTPDGPRAGELATRIDPNTADWPALAALPVIGEKLARAIVESRERYAADHPGEPAFATPDDLMRVKGIGRATTRALEPFLAFPAPPGE